MNFGFQVRLQISAGIPPGNNVVTGPYPLVIEEARGIGVVVQTGKYGKFLGVLDLSFDDLGMLRSWVGNPVYIDDRWTAGKTVGFTWFAFVLSELIYLNLLLII